MIRTTRQNLRVTMLIACLLTPPLTSRAIEETAAKSEEKTTLDLATMDLSVPENPAFTALDVSPETITRPTTARDFSASLLNGVDRKGNLQTGVAIDATPASWLAGRWTLQDYQSDYLMRLFARTSISVATTKGTDDADESMRLATGLRITFWDRGDPRKDAGLLQCIEIAVSHDETSANIERLQQELSDPSLSESKRTELKTRVEAMKAIQENDFTRTLSASLANGIDVLNELCRQDDAGSCNSANDSTQQRLLQYEITAQISAILASGGSIQDANASMEALDAAISEARTSGSIAPLETMKAEVASRADLSTAALRAEVKASAKSRISQLDSEYEELLNQKVNEQIKACRSNPEFLSNKGSASGFSISASPIWTSESGSITSLDDAGASLWASFAYGFEEFPAIGNHLQFIAHGRYSWNQSVPDGSAQGNLVEQDQAIVGGRLRAVWERWAMSTDAAWVYKDADSADSSIRYSVVAEYRIASNLWLSLGAGSDAGASDLDGNEGFVVGGLKFALGDAQNIHLGRPAR